MKYYSTLFLALFAIQLSYAQNSNIPEAQGGGFEFQKTTCLHDSDRAAMFEMIQENISTLGLSNTIQSSNSMVTSFGFPLKKADGLDWNNFYAISGFYDQDPSFNIIGDYSCSNRTYDGHKGVDIFTWPFAWYLVENDLVEVITAAAGTIVGKLDGNDHDNCNFENETWNAIYIMHSDGSMAWYGHMKNNSLTEKGIGSTVTKGEYLGIVASSGYSSGPHLHFEIFEDSNDDTSWIDPYQGNCNNLNNQSWWDDQEPYRESKLNVILTHNAVPIPWNCPVDQEEPNLSNQFDEGATIYFAAYYKDQIQEQISNYRIKIPSGSEWNSWNSSTTETYDASYWFWGFDMPIEGPFGNWTYEVTYEGETQIHPFKYGTNVSIDIIETQNIQIQPNPFSNHIRITAENNMDLSSATMELVTMDGKIIPVQITNSSSQNIILVIPNNISSGVYLLKINMNNGIIVKKIIRE
jgi:murein DD-endopeptidase MepM/ murein hydrolase activator NlpD